MNIQTFAELKVQLKKLRDNSFVVSFGQSNCCRAEMKIVGSTTMHYVCLECGKPCDPVQDSSREA